MEITPEIRAIKNAYMKAKDEKDQPEMNRLKAKAMSIMKSEKTDTNKKPESAGKEGIAVSKNKDGDSIEISLAGKRLNNLDDNFKNIKEKEKEVSL